jgi:hypothetical protein
MNHLEVPKKTAAATEVKRHLRWQGNEHNLLV